MSVCSWSITTHFACMLTALCLFAERYWHIPWLHVPDWQSPGTLHGDPGMPVVHVPFTQWVEEQAAPLLHGEPGPPFVHIPCPQ